jgi:hypothetical protein
LTNAIAHRSSGGLQTHQEFDDVGSHHLITIWSCPQRQFKQRAKIKNSALAFR